jgi:hypothetical protein
MPVIPTHGEKIPGRRHPYPCPSDTDNKFGEQKEPTKRGEINNLRNQGKTTSTV